MKKRTYRYSTVPMRSAATAAHVVAVTALALTLTWLFVARRKRRHVVSLPITLADKNGGAITVRVARVSDREEVVSSIADLTGTGSGTGNDDYLLQEFNRMVEDEDVLLLFAEDAETGKGLGMMAIVWSSPVETYWQSLRVSQAARGRGIASRLFDVAAHIALQRQGPASIGRWGVVSSNEVMTRWSERLGLHGPQRFRRYGAPASSEPPPLPPGYVLREATQEDVPAIMAFLKSAPVWNSEFGSQNFVLAGWGEFSEEMLGKLVTGATSRGLPVPSPRLLLSASGALVAFMCISFFQMGDQRFCMFRYADGAYDELRVLLHCLPSIAHGLKCVGCGGYVPTLPPIIAFMDASEKYKRATATEQHEFHWKNAEFAARIDLGETALAPAK